GGRRSAERSTWRLRGARSAADGRTVRPVGPIDRHRAVAGAGAFGRLWPVAHGRRLDAEERDRELVERAPAGPGDAEIVRTGVRLAGPQAAGALDGGGEAPAPQQVVEVERQPVVVLRQPDGAGEAAPRPPALDGLEQRRPLEAAQARRLVVGDPPLRARQ